MPIIVDAQYITIQDAAFAQCISNNLPGLIVNGNQLDTTAAKLKSGVLPCLNMGISNVYGLNYFQKVTAITLSGNNLTSLPAWDSLKSVQTLLLIGNQLTSIPAVTNLKNLVLFDCTSNFIDSLPNFSNLKNLKRLQISNNKIKYFPVISGDISLTGVIANTNQISQLPTVSLPGFIRLLLSWNRFTSVDVTKIPSLTQIHFVGNQLTHFPNISGMTNITELRLYSNHIDSLPDLSLFTKLLDFEVDSNNLQFSDLLPLKNHPNFSSFIISPQNMIGRDDTLIQKERSKYQWALAKDSGLVHTSYQWFKDGVVVSNTRGIFQIPLLSKSNQGTYSCVITNSDLPNLTLHSAQHSLRVVDCMDLSQLEVNYPNSSCKYPVTATIVESSIDFAQKPYTYQLVNTVLGIQYSASNASLLIPKEGTYTLTVTDSIGCSSTLPNYISIQRPENCNPIFYPGLNATDGVYYIELKGTALIYNSKGKKVRELVTPAYWNGTDQAGRELESGLYLIVVNENLNLEVSLMRVN